MRIGEENTHQESEPAKWPVLWVQTGKTLAISRGSTIRTSPHACTRQTLGRRGASVHRLEFTPACTANALPVALGLRVPESQSHCCPAKEPGRELPQ